MKFSILICHLATREALLQRLQGVLRPQVEGRPVEVLVQTDAGEMPIGEKRNRLIQRAQGEFVAFIDDDDLVATDYVSRILATIDQASNDLPPIDCIGIEGIITTGGPQRLNPRRFVHSLRYNRWFEQGGVYYRMPNHLNPIARRHASQVPFPQKNFGEDQDWSTAISPRLRREVYLEGPLYFYECR